MAEIHYAYYLPVSSTATGDTKRKRISQILSWAAPLVEVPDDLAAVLDEGIGGGGVGFATFKWASISEAPPDAGIARAVRILVEAGVETLGSIGGGTEMDENLWTHLPPHVEEQLRHFLAEQALTERTRFVQPIVVEGMVKALIAADKALVTIDLKPPAQTATLATVPWSSVRVKGGERLEWPGTTRRDLLVSIPGRATFRCVAYIVAGQPPGMDQLALEKLNAVCDELVGTYRSRPFGETWALRTAVRSPGSSHPRNVGLSSERLRTQLASPGSAKLW